MKDSVETLKLRDLHVSHTLGCAGDRNTQRELMNERFASVMVMVIKKRVVV